MVSLAQSFQIMIRCFSATSQLNSSGCKVQICVGVQPITYKLTDNQKWWIPASKLIYDAFHSVSPNLGVVGCPGLNIGTTQHTMSPLQPLISPSCLWSWSTSFIALWAWNHCQFLYWVAVQERDVILDELKSCLTRAQEKMKKTTNLHRRDVHFELGDMVYLKL